MKTHIKYSIVFFAFHLQTKFMSLHFLCTAIDIKLYFRDLHEMKIQYHKIGPRQGNIDNTTYFGNINQYETFLAKEIERRRHMPIIFKLSGK